MALVPVSVPPPLVETHDCSNIFWTVLLFGIVTGWSLSGIIDGLLSCLCGYRRYGNINVLRGGGSSIVFSGFIVNQSVTQLGGRVWVNGVEVGSDNQFSTSCTKSLRIIADGKVLDTHLQPGTPIHIHADPGIVLKDVHVEDELHVNGNIESCGTLSSEESCIIQGYVKASSVYCEEDLTVTGDLNCNRAEAEGDIQVGGDLIYTGTVKAEDSIRVTGTRRRRDSIK